MYVCIYIYIYICIYTHTYTFIVGWPRRRARGNWTSCLSDPIMNNDISNDDNINGNNGVNN